MDTRKILFFSNCSARNGAPLVIRDICTLPSPAGTVLHVCFPAPGPVAEDLRARGIQVHTLEPDNAPYKRYEPSHQKKIRNLLKALEPDAVIANTAGSLIPCGISGKQRIPTVLFLHEILEPGTGSMKRLVKAVQGIDLIISVTEQGIRQLPSTLRVPACVYRPGILPDAAHEHEDLSHIPLRGRAIVAVIATISPLKGIHILPAVAKKAQETDCSFAMLVIGPVPEKYRPYKEEIIARITAEGLKDTIFFIGEHDNPRALLAQTKILLQTSRTEALSRVIMEAMSAGAIPIAFDVGGNKELIDHGKDGFLVPPFDTDAMAGAMVRILPSCSSAVLAEQAREKVLTHFNAAVQISSFWSIIDSMIKTRRAAR